MSDEGKKGKATFEEYLANEETAEFKSEFYAGEIYAMSGGTRNHSLIGANIVRELGNALMGKDCVVYNSDLKIRIEAADASAYPDATVICGTEECYEDRKDILVNPTLVLEVLSEGTAGWDRGGKFRRYEMLSSLKEYVVVEQNAPQVDVFRRNPQGLWVLERFDGLDSVVEFQSLGTSVALSGIYYRVEFEEG